MSKINKQTMVGTFKQFWNSAFFTSCLLCLSLGINYAALAEYKKPSTEDDAPQGDETTITGSRGVGSCSEEATTNLTALAPYGHIGKSASTHPTFAWHVPDADTYPVQFRLYEYDGTKNNGKGKTIVKETLSSTPGIMTYALSPDSPGLTVGQKYIWQVILICNPNSPSQSLVIGTGINIVNPSSEITTKLNKLNDPSVRADIYAEAGLWYDALAEVASNPQDPQAQAFTTELIVNLTAIEEQHSTNPGGGSSKAIKIQQQHQEQLAEISAALTANQ